MKPRYESLATWIQVEGPQVPGDGFETAHLDELSYPRSMFRSVSALEQLFAEGVANIQTHGLGLDLILVVTIEAIDSVTEFPRPKGIRLKGLLEEASDEEPPSFYLVGRDLCLMDRNIEEYRCPVHWEIPGLSTESYSVYFRIYREPEDIDNDWEYYRALYVHWSPPVTS